MKYLTCPEWATKKRTGFAVTLSFSALLLMNYPLEGRSAEFEVIVQNGTIISPDQAEEMQRRIPKNEEHRSTRTRESEPNEQLILSDRRDFEKVLLRDYPGTYLLYVKLVDQEKEKIFASYLQTREIGIVREAVIEQVGH